MFDCIKASKVSSPDNVEDCNTVAAAPGFASATSSHGKFVVKFVVITALILAPPICYVHPVGGMNQAAATTASPTLQMTPFIIARQMKMMAERMQECHRIIRKFIVKDLQPFAAVESKWFR